MYHFDPDLSLKANYRDADDIEFAAWELACHEHREKYRDSGRAPGRTAWLHKERMQALKAALADGELLALGIARGDQFAAITLIPENLFLSPDLQIDGDRSAIFGLGREFDSVRICFGSTAEKILAVSLNGTGRPNHLPVIMAAWAALKAEIPEFLD